MVTKMLLVAKVKHIFDRTHNPYVALNFPRVWLILLIKIYE